MKRFNFLFLIGFLAFFLGFNNVDAKVSTGINIDADNHFNYYYEQRESTEFYNWLRTTNMPEYFSSQSANNETEYPWQMYIFYADDLRDTEIKYMRSIYGCSGACYDNVSIPNNAKYAVYFNSTYHNIFQSFVSSQQEGNRYNLTFSFNSNNMTDRLNSSNAIHTIAFFDENGEELSRVGSSYFTYTTSYNIKGHDDDSSADFTYFLSSIYKTGSIYQPSIGLNKIVVSDIIEDNTHYLIDDNDNYNGWLRRLLSFYSLKYRDVVDSDLKYFKTNIIKEVMPDLYTILENGVSINIPEGYSYITIDDDNTNYVFFPKDISNTDLSRKLYTSTTETINYNQFTLGVNAYEIDNNYKAPYEESSLFKVKYNKPNHLYNIDYENYIHNKIGNNVNVFDYALSFAIFGNPKNATANVYYKDDSYSYCIYHHSNRFHDYSNETCTFKHPETGQDVTITNGELYDILAQNDTLAVSVDVFDSADNQCAISKEYSELYEYDENCNIVGTKSTAGLSGFLGTLTDIVSWAKGFIGVITTIFSMFTLFFSSLPDEIRYCFLFGLVGGTIILIYKLIRGS